MSYAIVGFGKIGQALAKAFARKGIEVSGFAPIKPGGLSEGGLLVQARGNSRGRLIFQDLVKFD
jgi:phosphoglycerate dehydrogenase-like enzyme